MLVITLYGNCVCCYNLIITFYLERKCIVYYKQFYNVLCYNITPQKWRVG